MKKKDDTPHPSTTPMKTILAVILSALTLTMPLDCFATAIGNQSQETETTPSQGASIPNASSQDSSSQKTSLQKTSLQNTSSPQSVSIAGQTQPTAEQVPDSPSAVRTAAQLNSQSASSPTGEPTTPEQTQPEQQPEQSQTQPQSNPQLQSPRQPYSSQPSEPVGTAVAAPVPTVGVAASRPAGAAVAPAKQRRVRTILITTGAIIGAGIALGTTMALSEGSPSRPAGAR